MEQVATGLGQPVVVENRTGAGNTIAMAAVARAEPDGYTVLANSSTHSLVPVTYGALPFDTFRDLTPIIPLSNTPLVMVVASSKGYKNVAEFVAAAKAKRGAMNYSSGGVGSITHLAMEAFRLAAGFEAVHVPFKGAPEALTEVLAERADFYFSPLPATLSFLKDGKLQALAVSGSHALRAPCPTCRRSKKRGILRPHTISGSACSCRRRPRRRSWTGFTERPPRRCRAPVLKERLRPRRRRSPAARPSRVRQADPGRVRSQQQGRQGSGRQGELIQRAFGKSRNRPGAANRA